MNSPCIRISTHIDVYKPSEDDYRLFIEKLNDICFYQLLVAIFFSFLYFIFVPLRGTKTRRLLLLHETLHRPEPLQDCLNIFMFFYLFDS